MLPEIFGSWKILSPVNVLVPQKIWFPKRFRFSKEFLVSRNFGFQQYFRSRKILGLETFVVPKNARSRKYLVPGKFGVQKNFGPKKIWGPQKFSVPKNFGSWNISNPLKKSGPEKFWVYKCWVPKNFGCMHRAVCVEMFCTQSRHLPDTIYSLGCENWLGGGWVGGFHHDNRAIPWPNLQVRTCKIQAKLDSKLGPSVAIHEYQVSVSVTTKPQGVFSQNKQNLWALNHKILVSSERVCNHQTPGCFFLRISRTYGLLIKRYCYQVSVSVTTKPQGAFFSE